MDPKVSVIVPIYNVEAYLPRCLDSLRCQTLSDIEIILVDDGSPDRCGEIADRYAREDSRFRVIHQANAGLSSARNRGIELATAPYLMFVDSDDWVEPDFCRIPFEAAEEHGADLVIFRFFLDGSSNRKTESELMPDGLRFKEETIPMLFYSAGVAAWNKLYRRYLFETIRYPEGFVCEDHGTTYRLVQRAGRIWVSNVALYHYCFREDSITHLKEEKTQRDYYEMKMQEIHGLEVFGYSELAEALKTDTCLSYLIHFGTQEKLSKECIQALSAEKRLWMNGTWKRRILLKVFLHSPRLFDLICVLSGKRKKD